MRAPPMNQIQTVGSGTFERAIARAPEAMREVAWALRRLVAKVMPDVTEVPWVRQGNVGYGVGPKKMSEQFCYIMPASQHVNLGFYYGADLDDPQRLLEGAGKNLRHVKVRSVADAKALALERLLRQASVHLPRRK